MDNDPEAIDMLRFPILFVLTGIGVAAPAMAQLSADAPASTCGRISDFDAAPRSQDLYRARLMNVDGQLPGPTGSRSYRVSPGPHTLQVAELIDNDQFNDLQLQQRVRNANRYKTLQIDVQPGVTYSLAAKLVEARRNYILDQSYWQPVIYRQVNAACR